jgi:acyl-CoA synthetase (AMP-forming)/AMP-acid ligase II
MWLRAITRYRGTTSGGPNFMFDLCCRRISFEQCEGLDLRSWHVAFNGAERINAATLDRFTQKFATFGFRRQAFLPCYGLAEATLCASCDIKPNRPNIIRVEEKSLCHDRVSIHDDGMNIVSCGLPRSNHICRIVDPTTFQEKKNGEVGEIWLAGPSVAQGYWNRPELTRETFQANLANEESNFLRTGDLGAIVENNLLVLGRMKDLVILRGRNYYASDIEFSIFEALENIEANSTSAFSIDVVGYEQLVVIQECRLSVHDVDSLNQMLMAIRRAVFSREQLQVEIIVLVKCRMIPKTPSGKIQRVLCRNMYLNGQLMVIREWNKGESRKSELHREGNGITGAAMAGAS